MGIKQLAAGSYGIDGVYIQGAAAVAGPKEGRGPLGPYFDRVWASENPRGGSFEQAERELLRESQETVLQKTGMTWADIDLAVGGDLLDEIISTNFAAREHARPLAGLFSACAVFAEALAAGAAMVGGGGPRTVLVSAVSHNKAAERQYRYPIELGYQRTPTAAWTATAAGSVVLADRPAPLAIEAATFGRVIDFGLKDPNDLGSAMAPAAVDTIGRHLDALGCSVSDYDAIFTGDLGQLGVQLAVALLERGGRPPGNRLDDCGRSLYHLDSQDVHNGGSGPGCSASVFSGYLVGSLMSGRFRRLLLVATGALFSPTTYQQGESIPAIAHAVSVVHRGESS